MGGKGGSNYKAITSSRNDLDKSIINSIMLKFRPIAPKPAGEEPVSRKILHEKWSATGRNGRPKRKYVRVQRQKKKRKNPSSEQLAIQDLPSKRGLVTLQLLPEKLHDKNLQTGNFSNSNDDKKFQEMPVWTNMKAKIDEKNADFDSANLLVVGLQSAQVKETWVIIECVTDTFMDEVGLGFSDMERINNLHADTSPGFISDCSNKVVWLNEAYKNMVFNQDCKKRDEKEDVIVYLVVKEKLPYFCQAFACKVRVQYIWNGKKCSRTVPCDVWRMQFGGFAWKLDVKAALSLGL